MKKMYFNWSSGKDSALALHYLQQDNEFDIDLLLSTVNSKNDRVAMHGTQAELLKAQAEATGLKISLLELPGQPTMEEYNSIMTNEILRLKALGYEYTGFGDISLEDIRQYRERMLSPMDIKPVFPLWKKDTRALMHNFLEQGFRTVIVAAKADLMGKEFLGQELTKGLLNELPEEVDPCGENGEFHTFCFDGPIFQEPVKFTLGEKVYQTYPNPDKESTQKEIGFWFIDLRG
ncbi:MAG: diphthine--ammonia ligase [Bacteroidales bacterium]|nr:diphthine--ammonia ligase [Bacteroidales bacterium]MCF8337458.1 diphthine--ammonia ligase [Bacteroidales bacterium]